LTSWIPGYRVCVAKVFGNVGGAFASTSAVRSLVSAPSSAISVTTTGIAVAGLRSEEVRGDQAKSQHPW
jgi:hypothetical protein